MSKTYRSIHRTYYCLTSVNDQVFLTEQYGCLKKAKALLTKDGRDFNYIDKKGLKKHSSRKVRYTQKQEIYNTLYRNKEYDLTADNKIQTDIWSFD